MFISFEEAKKCEVDAKLIMEWRNDPETLKASFHTKPKHWDSFFQEYCNEYFKNQDLSPIFAFLDGEKIAFLRFRKYFDSKIMGRVTDISINLSPKKRGLGLGTEIIKKGAAYLFGKGYETIVAEIKQENIISICAFERAGFSYFDLIDKKIEDTGEVFTILRFILHKI